MEPTSTVIATRMIGSIDQATLISNVELICSNDNNVETTFIGLNILHHERNKKIEQLLTGEINAFTDDETSLNCPTVPEHVDFDFECTSDVVDFFREHEYFAHPYVESGRLYNSYKTRIMIQTAIVSDTNTPKQPTKFSIITTRSDLLEKYALCRKLLELRKQQTIAEYTRRVLSRVLFRNPRVFAPGVNGTILHDYELPNGRSYCDKTIESILDVFGKQMKRQITHTIFDSTRIGQPTILRLAINPLPEPTSTPLIDVLAKHVENCERSEPELKVATDFAPMINFANALNDHAAKLQAETVSDTQQCVCNQ